MKYLMSILFLLIVQVSLGQSTIIKGKIYYQDTPIQDAMVEICKGNVIQQVVSKRNGSFEFSLPEISSDSIFISAYRDGLPAIRHQHIIDSSLQNLKIFFPEPEYNLDEITITASSSITESANKQTFRVDSQKFSPGTKTDIVLGTLPGIASINGEIMINQKKTALFFLDGIASRIEDLQNLGAEEIEKIEVIPNPSAKYGSELQGGIINIIRKKSSDTFIKGELRGGVKTRLGNWSLRPSFSFRNKWMIFNTYYNYQKNNSHTQTSIERTEDSKTVNNQVFGNVNGYQDYFTARAKFTFSPKADLALYATQYTYSFDQLTQELFIDASKNYQFLSLFRNKKLDGVFNWNITPTQRMLVKYNYEEYYDKHDLEVLESAQLNKSTIQSSISEVNYENDNFKVFGIQSQFTAGYRNISRKNLFQSVDFEHIQVVNSLFADLNMQISKSFSGYISLHYETEKNQGIQVKKNRQYFLPTLSTMLKLSPQVSLQARYSKKILRPSAEYMNPNDIVFNSTNIERGNPMLRAQNNNSYEIEATIRKGKTISSISIYSEVYDRQIVRNWLKEDNLIVYKYDNSGKTSIHGSRFNLSAGFAKFLMFNVGCGISYNVLNPATTGNINSLKTQGWAFNAISSLSFVSPKGWNANWSFNYTSKRYSLIGNTQERPLMVLNIQRSFCRGRLVLGFNYFDMFDCYYVTKTRYNSPKFSQTSIVKSHLTNFTFSATISIGKKFSDSMKNKTIENNDILKKY